MILLPFVLPICIWVAYADMSRMKIPNYAVLSLLAIFVVLGPFVFGLESFLWRIGGGLIVLGIGFLMNQIGMVGAGDAKFAAAMAPFIALSDLGVALILFAFMLIMSFIAHRIARAIPMIRNATPNWESWTHKKFPMGLALAATLAAYLVLKAIYA